MHAVGSHCKIVQVPRSYKNFHLCDLTLTKEWINTPAIGFSSTDTGTFIQSTQQMQNMIVLENRVLTWKRKGD